MRRYRFAVSHAEYLIILNHAVIITLKREAMKIVVLLTVLTVACAHRVPYETPQTQQSEFQKHPYLKSTFTSVGYLDKPDSKETAPTRSDEGARSVHKAPSVSAANLETMKEVDRFFQQPDIKNIQSKANMYLPQINEAITKNDKAYSDLMMKIMGFLEPNQPEVSVKKEITDYEPKTFDDEYKVTRIRQGREAPAPGNFRARTMTKADKIPQQPQFKADNYQRFKLQFNEKPHLYSKPKANVLKNIDGAVEKPEMRGIEKGYPLNPKNANSITNLERTIEISPERPEMQEMKTRGQLNNDKYSEQAEIQRPLSKNIGEHRYVPKQDSPLNANLRADAPKVSPMTQKTIEHQVDNYLERVETQNEMPMEPKSIEHQMDNYFERAETQHEIPMEPKNFEHPMDNYFERLATRHEIPVEPNHTEHQMDNYFEGAETLGEENYGPPPVPSELSANDESSLMESIAELFQRPEIRQLASASEGKRVVREQGVAGYANAEKEQKPFGGQADFTGCESGYCRRGEYEGFDCKNGVCKTVCKQDECYQMN